MASVTTQIIASALLALGCSAQQMGGTQRFQGPCSDFNASATPPYNYTARGTDWAANKKWQCGGSSQSPVEYLTPSDYKYVSIPASQSVVLGKPNVTNGAVLNPPFWEIEVLGNISGNGLAVPVCNGTDLGCLESPGVAPKYVNVSIANLHFHTPSEHTYDGEYFALESHLVTVIAQKDVPSCPAAGCKAVFGAFYRIDARQRNNSFLAQLMPHVNLTAAACTNVPANVTIDLASGFPTDRTYISYMGSLTTPPCTEGVLWISFIKPLHVSSAQLEDFWSALTSVPGCTTTAQGKVCSSAGYQADSRILQDLNGRTLHMYSPSTTALSN